MNLSEQQSTVLKKFGSAFFKRDLEALAACTTDDVEWRFAVGADAPFGRRYVGIDGFALGFQERDEKFRQVRYDEVKTTALADGRVLMEYRVIGTDADGNEIDLYGLELYAFRDGRVALKDAYWKQPDPRN
jgi:ketosteroid isomerase-like protein